ncbi:MAG: sodium-dependent transporter, partial [Lachnospiraceae bacterium]|nr:sodium-dependent transporter [Lachnospiraceae bacterium]
GWMMSYAFQCATGKLQGLDKNGIEANFDAMLADPTSMTIWMVIAVVISLSVGLLGLQNGVEKITKILMLVLLALMVVLAINSLMLDGAMEGLKYYLYPDFSKIGDRGLGTVVFDALTHAFFTLSLGMGSMEIFGSYLKKDRTLFGESVSIVCVDTLVALTAGLIIIPACFAFGVGMDAGPSLLFITLNNVFNAMEGGRIWGTIFFIFMSFAALSTVIAVCENINSFYMDMFAWSRKKAIALNTVLIIVLSMPAVLGYNVWSFIQPMGEGSTIMDLEDFLVSYNILPLGGLIFVLFCVRKNGWGFENFREEANIGIGKKVPEWIRGYMSYVLPLVIVVVYLKGYYDTFAKMGTTALIGWMTFAVVLLVFIFFVAFYQKKDKTVAKN